MSATGSPPPGAGALELPPFSLDVESLDLGSDVKAVGLELLGTESREPVRGKEAAAIWAAVFPALAANECYVLDFFSHVDRVREFCKIHEIHFREAADRCIVLPQPREASCRTSLGGSREKRSACARVPPPSRRTLRSKGTLPARAGRLPAGLRTL